MLRLNTDVLHKVGKNGVIFYVFLHLVSFPPSEKYFIIAPFLDEVQKMK